MASSSNQVAVLSALTSGVPRLLLSYLKKNVLDSDHNALLDSGPHKDPQFVVAMEEKTSASFIGDTSGCLGPTWELQDGVPLLYR